MKRAQHTFRIVGLLVGVLCLGNLAIDPARAATITYNFSGIVTTIDPALGDPLPFSTAGPLSTMSGSIKVFTTPIGTGYHGEGVQLTIGSYQVQFSFTPGDHVVEVSNTGASDGFGITSAQDGMTLNPNSPVNSWFPHVFFMTLEGPPSLFSSAALPGPSELPPSINAFSDTNQWRLLFYTEDLNGPVVVQGTITSLSAVPLPVSVILFGVGLVALIGLGAGNFRSN